MNFNTIQSCPTNKAMPHPPHRIPIKEWGKKTFNGTPLEKVFKNIQKARRSRLEEARRENFEKIMPKYFEKKRQVEEKINKEPHDPAIEEKQQSQIQKNEAEKLNTPPDNFLELSEKLLQHANKIRDKISQLFQSKSNYENTKTTMLENAEKAFQNALTQLEKLPKLPLILSFSSIESEFLETCNKQIEAAALQTNSSLFLTETT